MSADVTRERASRFVTLISGIEEIAESILAGQSYDIPLALVHLRPAIAAQVSRETLDKLR